MSALKKIHDYYRSNSSLIAAIPFERFWSGWVPPTLRTYPYASLYALSPDTVDWLTAGGVERFHCQITVYSTSLDEVESVLDVYENEFNWKSVSQDNGWVIRTGRMAAQIDGDQPQAGVPVYSGWLEYEFGFTLPGT